MTIRKGEPWGTAVDRPVDLVTVPGDVEFARRVEAGTSGPVAVSGGDLHCSLGGPPPRPEMQRLPLDVIDVVVDGKSLVAVAHVVARRGWWRGRVIAACNVDRIGDWDVAPRAHPNDGRIDIVDVDAAMSVRHRWQAWRRLPAGTHVPHPNIATRSVTTERWAFERAVGVWVDGRRVGEAREVSVAVRPDAATLWI